MNFVIRKFGASANGQVNAFCGKYILKKQKYNKSPRRYRQKSFGINGFE